MSLYFEWKGLLAFLNTLIIDIRRLSYEYYKGRRTGITINNN